MRQKLNRLLDILNLIFRCLLIVVVMILPFVQFVYAYSFSDYNGELEEYARMASCSSTLFITTSPCLYGLALYMLRDLLALLPQRKFFVVCGSALRWVLKILFGLACFGLVLFIIAVGVEYLI